MCKDMEKRRQNYNWLNLVDIFSAQGQGQKIWKGKREKFTYFFTVFVIGKMHWKNPETFLSSCRQTQLFSDNFFLSMHKVWKSSKKCLIFNSTWIWNPNAPKMVRTLGCKLWKFIRNDFQMRLFWVIFKHCVLREEFYNHTESLTWNKEPWLLKWCGNGRWAWWAAAAAAAAAAENGMKNEWRPWFCVGSWAFSQFLAARVA